MHRQKSFTVTLTLWFAVSLKEEERVSLRIESPSRTEMKLDMICLLLLAPGPAPCYITSARIINKYSLCNWAASFRSKVVCHLAGQRNMELTVPYLLFWYQLFMSYLTKNCSHHAMPSVEDRLGMDFKTLLYQK